MCSDPQEFYSKDTGEIYTVACRKCDDCIATRRHGWVARAMMEKASCSHSAVIALTYADHNQQTRDAARFFCYADVQDFLKRLRAAAYYEAKIANWNFKPSIRFLCAGEQGDRNGRCHWHLILFTNFDIARLGQFRLRGHLVSHRRDMLSEGKRKRRLNWSLWKHGFMTLQEPDQGGMNYVLSYCLKDQFTQEKSSGTMRESKSENFATGLFRMSKYPPIGHDWLMRKMEALDATGSVLPSLNLKIPGFAGYYQPSGSVRKKLLWLLVALNQRALWSTGAVAPQWPSLLASVATLETDLDILNVKKAQEKYSDDYPGDAGTVITTAHRLGSGEYRRAETRRKCGAVIACDECLHSQDDATLRAYGVRRFESDGVWRYAATDDAQIIAFARHNGQGINPLCQQGGTKEARLAFPASGTGTGPAHL